MAFEKQDFFVSLTMSQNSSSEVSIFECATLTPHLTWSNAEKRSLKHIGVSWMKISIHKNQPREHFGVEHAYRLGFRDIELCLLKFASNKP